MVITTNKIRQQDNETSIYLILQKAEMEDEDRTE